MTVTDVQMQKDGWAISSDSIEHQLWGNEIGTSVFKTYVEALRMLRRDGRGKNNA